MPLGKWTGIAGSEQGDRVLDRRHFASEGLKTGEKKSLEARWKEWVRMGRYTGAPRQSVGGHVTGFYSPVRNWRRTFYVGGLA